MRTNPGRSSWPRIRCGNQHVEPAGPHLRRGMPVLHGGRGSGAWMPIEFVVMVSCRDVAASRFLSQFYGCIALPDPPAEMPSNRESGRFGACPPIAWGERQSGTDSQGVGMLGAGSPRIDRRACGAAACSIGYAVNVGGSTPAISRPRRRARGRSRAGATPSVRLGTGRPSIAASGTTCWTEFVTNTSSAWPQLGPRQRSLAGRHAVARAQLEHAGRG